MDGIHDLGGVDGFGTVDAPASEPYFSDEWERRAFMVNMAVLGAVNPGGPGFRHSIERMDPAHYLTSSYYEHWLTGAATLLVEAGVTSKEELERRAGGAFPLSRPKRGRAPEDTGDDRSEPRFAVGDRVRVREIHPLGHTRAPRYVQGKTGVVTRVDGASNYPDLEGYGLKVLDPAYSVRFTAEELWGDGGAPAESVNVDLSERYLEIGE